MLLYSQEQMYNPQAAARHYPSPHHSPSMDLGKPVPAHHHHQHEQHQRWGGWEYAPKQQRLPPSPPMHPHIHHAYAAAATSAYGHPDEDYHHQQQQQQMPMTPPTSEGFMSPDLGGQQWMLQSTTPPPSLSSSAGLFPDLQQQQRKKRRLTEPAEANYHCGLCGKYFSRVWNYNAHRETHDPSRAKPHACRADGCGKAFVRRTDLARHVQCVHEKDKKFKCALCNNRFARKDTLRRVSFTALLLPFFARFESEGFHS
ncbi:hypothetical protein DFH27DRAFT_523633 [Peziza echinospora]|nr:hypothetical protein DFH27DRAFT_523633 [Peziza echinospora]